MMRLLSNQPRLDLFVDTFLGWAMFEPTLVLLLLHNPLDSFEKPQSCCHGKRFQKQGTLAFWCRFERFEEQGRWPRCHCKQNNKNRNKSTDVLSFPYFLENNLKFSRKKNIYIGDIAICYEIISFRADKNNFNQRPPILRRRPLLPFYFLTVDILPTIEAYALSYLMDYQYKYIV